MIFSELSLTGKCVNYGPDKLHSLPPILHIDILYSGVNCELHFQSGKLNTYSYVFFKCTIRSLFLTALVLYTSPFPGRTLMVTDILYVDARLTPASPSGTASAVSSALKAFKTLDTRYFIAGGTCAAISHGVTTPIDVVKTRIQSDPQKYNKGLIQAALKICKDDGIDTLGAGLGPTIVGYGIEGAMKFGVYEVMKSVFIELFGKSNKGIAYLLASMTAGAVAAIILCPMESTRIKMVTDPDYDNMGILTALPKMLKDDGMFTSFNGIWAMLAKQVPYTFGKQVSFDVFAGALYTFFHTLQESVSSLTDPQVKWLVSILSAFCASLVACIFSQPGDMILTLTYNKKDSHAASVVSKVAHSQKVKVRSPITNTIFLVFSRVIAWVCH